MEETMDATQAGPLEIDAEKRELRSSTGGSSPDLPPPPAQLVAALREFESNAPDSFRVKSSEPAPPAEVVAPKQAKKTSARLWLAGGITVAVIVAQIVWALVH